jgi:cellulose synthase/poly-beta-1,6-N-acetylglucosamine synthase-like glycosyltransferase
MRDALNYLYIFLVLVISIFGLHALTITTLYLLRFRRKPAAPSNPDEWPLVAVQLPLYNEMLVVERMIDTVCKFDYPRDRLIIQVLDDSTDQTQELARQRVAHYRAQGFQIELIHRTDRVGFKAGALAEGLASTQAEFVAVFDADFIPPPDFLRRVIPYFFTDARLGMVQTRWGHLNRDSNLLTRTQALFLDGHQVVEQVARSRSNLFCNFNGSGGVWRTACIRDSGGWQIDTLSEDIDLSFRAQLKGWRLTFLPDLIVPAEVPPSMPVFKVQQYRWVFGYVQVFRKLFLRLWTTPGLTLPQRMGGSFQLTTNLAHLFALTIFLLSLPLVLMRSELPSSMALISMASCGPTILFAVSQIFGYKDGPRRTIDRLVHLPVLVLLSIGMSMSNSRAVVSALTGRKREFVRTPKYNLESKRGGWNRALYLLPTEPGVYMELAVSIYCAIGLSLAINRAPDMIPLTLLGMLSFGYVGASGLFESNRPKKARKIEIEMAQQ